MAGKGRDLEQGSKENEMDEKQFVIDIEEINEDRDEYAAENTGNVKCSIQRNVNDEQDVDGDGESAALLPTTNQDRSRGDAASNVNAAARTKQKGKAKEEPNRLYAFRHLVLAFLAGIFVSLMSQYFLSTFCSPFPLPKDRMDDNADAFALPHAGKPTSNIYPPPSPTNAVSSLFPINVGYEGATPTGAEAAMVATAPATPSNGGSLGLLAPQIKFSSKPKSGGKGKHKGKDDEEFDIFKYWGNLSPWYSNKRGALGLDSDSEAPDGCVVTALHFLHRHGARYPTSWMSYGGPKQFADRMHKSANKWNARDELEFLNDWTYKLGSELLTPFGRQQLFDLGVSLRMRYGYLLNNFTETDSLPVFRTESQHRMLHSALNFANGFFGLPTEGQYLQSVTIEANGFNNTLAPYKTCPNSNIPSKADRGTRFMIDWAQIYLKDAAKRLGEMIDGYDFNIEDMYCMQQLCAYETVALGYSKFCELFTVEEWEGFEYALDIYFWYDVAFGSPVARVQGIGYIQELVARLTNTPIQTHNSSTNATLDDNDLTFPLGKSLYVDATHETVVLNILTALNLSTLASTGPLPTDHIPENRSFIVSQLAPFSTNVQFQVLSCSSTPDPQIRIIVNDAPVPLTPLHSPSSGKSCPDQKDGMCPVDTFVGAMREMISVTDWEYDCYGKWEVSEDWHTLKGESPQ